MRIEYTSSSKKRYLVRHVCSNCGHDNLHVHTVTETVNASTGGFATQKREQKLQSQMRDALNENMNSRLKQITEEAKARKYYSAKYHIRCDKCRHTEPWSKLDYEIFKTISYLLLIAAIIKGFFVYEDSNIEDFIVYLIVVLSLVGASYLIRYFRRKALDKKIQALPPESLPMIFDIK